MCVDSPVLQTLSQVCNILHLVFLAVIKQLQLIYHHYLDGVESTLIYM